MSAADISTLVVSVAAVLSALATYLRNKAPVKQVESFLSNHADLTTAVESQVTSLLTKHGYVRVSTPASVPPAGTTTVPPTSGS